ncbi:hypothetical protein CDAR_603241 [Caerostris darwini]|uniref:Uncharacterized protein n=1 Tax=Caerostris darwini TaxID=1538125 RepID=A0AAV4PM08_9ARAC|nr:hypothetical protein CDAR_603241 [Caerostris darwini]
MHIPEPQPKRNKPLQLCNSKRRENREEGAAKNPSPHPLQIPPPIPAPVIALGHHFTLGIVVRLVKHEGVRVIPIRRWIYRNVKGDDRDLVNGSKCMMYEIKYVKLPESLFVALYSSRSPVFAALFEEVISRNGLSQQMRYKSSKAITVPAVILTLKWTHLSARNLTAGNSRQIEIKASDDRLKSLLRPIPKARCPRVAAHQAPRLASDSRRQIQALRA